MIWIKVYITQGETLLAACDDDVLGKTFEEGELCLSVTEAFFGGEKVSREMFIEQLNEATIVNLVGKEVIMIASELGMMDENGVIEIAGIPHAQIARLM